MLVDGSSLLAKSAFPFHSKLDLHPFTLAIRASTLSSALPLPLTSHPICLSPSPHYIAVPRYAASLVAPVSLMSYAVFAVHCITLQILKSPGFVCTIIDLHLSPSWSLHSLLISSSSHSDGSSCISLSPSDPIAIPLLPAAYFVFSYTSSGVGFVSWFHSFVFPSESKVLNLYRPSVCCAT